jgi:hypothetical protein
MHLTSPSPLTLYEFVSIQQRGQGLFGVGFSGIVVLSIYLHLAVTTVALVLCWFGCDRDRAGADIVRIRYICRMYLVGI